MSQQYSMEYGDFLRELGRYAPEFMLRSHLSTIRSFCLSLPSLIDQLTAADMDDLRDTLIDWLEDDDNYDGALLKEGGNPYAKPPDLCSHRTVFMNAARYLKKAYSERIGLKQKESGRKAPPKKQQCAVCKWHHKQGDFTRFSSGDGKLSVSVTENSRPHAALKVLHLYMEQNEGLFMHKDEWATVSSDNPYDIFRRQKTVWGMIECSGANVRIAPPNHYRIRKRQKKSLNPPAVKRAVRKR